MALRNGFRVLGALSIGALPETDGAPMHAHPTNWPLAMTAALALALLPGAAHARGGGHASHRSATPPSHMQPTHAPTAGLPGAQPSSGSPGGTLHRRLEVPGANSTGRPPAAIDIMRRAIADRPLPTHSPAGATATNDGTSKVTTSSPLPISGGGTSPSPPPPETVTPPPAIAAPLPELVPIPPLSPQLPTQFATGGVTQPSLALSPGGSSSSPSESAPSAPGGGGKTLTDCMGFWDRETHMTKVEWKAACLRTMQEYPSVR